MEKGEARWGSNRKENHGHGLNAKKIIFAILITAVIVYFWWFFFHSYTRCFDEACFSERLSECKRALFVGSSDEMVYEYFIEGKSDGHCSVNVKLLQGQLNEKNSLLLEGKEMTCRLPIGLLIRPEGELTDCSGPLKEGLQEVIIEKLHTYLISNLDRVNEEIKAANKAG